MPLPDITLGQRYAVRVVDDGGARDLVGALVAADADSWTLLPEERGPEMVRVQDVRAARVVPQRVVRPTSSVDDLERLTWRGWPGLEQARVGGWVLRFGHGCTLRANSALVVGDPGATATEAIAAVEQTYRGRGLQPRFLVPRGRDGGAPAIDAELAERGYVVEGGAEVLVTDLRTLDGPPTTLVAEWSDSPVADWWRVLGGDRDRQDGYAEELEACPARYLVLRAGDTPVARARLTVTQDWGGVTALVVDRTRRRQGLGASAMAEVVAEAVRRGARFGYLQVETHNEAALALYARLGWQQHHAYHFRTAPQEVRATAQC